MHNILDGYLVHHCFLYYEDRAFTLRFLRHIIQSDAHAINTGEKKMESNLNIPESKNEHEKGFGSGLLWLLKGFVFPCWSRTFYKKAIEKKVIIAVVFFLMFAFVQTSVTAIQVAIAMKSVGSEISAAYESGEFPTITIKDGIASADGTQPYVFASQRDVIAIDTTGKTREIDTKAYSRGLLLTRTEIHFVNEDGYQVLPLADLHESFGNPILIDKTQVLDLWQKIALGINLIATIGVFLWNSLVRFAYIALLGLVVWGIVSIKRQGTGFGFILITSIYANVPATYILFILKKIGVSFFSLYTLLLIIIWTIVLYVVLKQKDKDLSTLDSEEVSI